MPVLSLHIISIYRLFSTSLDLTLEELRAVAFDLVKAFVNTRLSDPDLDGRLECVRYRSPRTEPNKVPKSLRLMAACQLMHTLRSTDDDRRTLASLLLRRVNFVEEQRRVEAALPEELVGRIDLVKFESSYIESTSTFHIHRQDGKISRLRIKVNTDVEDYYDEKITIKSSYRGRHGRLTSTQVYQGCSCDGGWETFTAGGSRAVYENVFKDLDWSPSVIGSQEAGSAEGDCSDFVEEAEAEDDTSFQVACNPNIEGFLSVLFPQAVLDTKVGEQYRDYYDFSAEGLSVLICIMLDLLE